jgi:CDP-4-dehydro-6-deoxyglucose reductase, E1
MKKIYYGYAVYDRKEINAVNEVLTKNNLTLIDGPSVKLFEKNVAKLFGKRFGLMVNSGSSANLLAIASLKLKKGSEIITPTLTFSTTVAPIYQLGMIPHFVDVEMNKFIINTEQIEKAINKKTKAIIVPNLLGNIPNYKKIYKIAKKYKLKIIEDSADTIGYTVNKKTFGKFTDIATTSFYASHIVTGAGFGGMACFNDKKLYEEAKILRGWGRSSATFNESEDIKKRFSAKVSGIPYDGKYIFLRMGYNFLPSEISAAFGLQQIKKLNNNISIRTKNFKYLKNFFSKFQEYVNLPITNLNARTPWLAFPLTIKKNNKFKRRDMQIYFEKNNIQTRTIFTGNILRQPIMKNLKYKSIKNSSLISDNVMENGILLGCHHGMKFNDLKYICKIFINFLKYKKALSTKLH